MKPILVQDFLEISYRADLNLLLGRWLRPIELTEMQRGYQLLLEAAVAGQCQQWLLDVRRQQNTHKVGAKWMVSIFLPQLGPSSGRTRLAYLMAPTYLRDADADAAFPPRDLFRRRTLRGRTIY